MSSDPKVILRIRIVESVPAERIDELNPLFDAGHIKALDTFEYPAPDSESEAFFDLYINVEPTQASRTLETCRKIFTVNETLPDIKALSWPEYLDEKIRQRQGPMPGNAVATILSLDARNERLPDIQDQLEFPSSRIPRPHHAPHVLAQDDADFLSALEFHLDIDFAKLPPPEIVRRKKSIAQIDGVADVAIEEWPKHRPPRHEHYRLIAFDMDSTLIEQEVIDELGREQDRYDEVAAITASALNGEIDFRESLRRRVALLKGMPVERLQDILEYITLTPGAERLVSVLKALGYKTAIISGGFDFVGTRIQEQLGIDHLRAHTLGEADGKLTGEVVGDVIDGAEKEALLREICRQEGIGLDQTIAIGDGANDLPMLKAAGMGIAFHAKPVVREAASFSISAHDLDAALFFLGLNDDDIGVISRRIAP